MPQQQFKQQQQQQRTTQSTIWKTQIGVSYTDTTIRREQVKQSNAFVPQNKSMSPHSSISTQCTTGEGR